MKENGDCFSLQDYIVFQATVGPDPFRSYEKVHPSFTEIRYPVHF